ncbi:hypothetical protein BSCH_01477 [Candidatus Paraburkholderia schumanniana]|nr:hypothetical protein BSCH_01477 [Candidatus Paraburkholderia schumannianae]
MKLPSKQVTHREWMVRSFPEKKGFHYHARVKIERGPGPLQGEKSPQVFTVTDIGYFDTEAAAEDRGVAWAKAWLDSNF